MKKLALLFFGIVGVSGLYMYATVWNALIPPAREAVQGIVFIADEVNYMQKPWETRVRGAGDCEDFAALIAERYIKDGIGFSLCVINGREQKHAVLKVGGFYVDSVRPRLILITKNNQPLHTWTKEEVCGFL